MNQTAREQAIKVMIVGVDECFAQLASIERLHSNEQLYELHEKLGDDEVYTREIASRYGYNLDDEASAEEKELLFGDKS
jgi:hypothetical protein